MFHIPTSSFINYRITSSLLSKSFIFLFALVSINLITITSAIAKQESSCPMPNDEITGKVKEFLANIRKIAVEFEQRDTRGAHAKGMLLIDKPHKFRCNYYAPFPLLIVGNKNYISVYDYEMENFARIKSEENIFNFLLLDKTEFSEQFEVIEQKELASSYELSIYHENLARTLRISFDKQTGQIAKILIFEDDNEITITFAQTRMLSSLDKRLFVLQDPEIFEKPKRLNKDDIDKLIK